MTYVTNSLTNDLKHIVEWSKKMAFWIKCRWNCCDIDFSRKKLSCILMLILENIGQVLFRIDLILIQASVCSWILSILRWKTINKIDFWSFLLCIYLDEQLEPYRSPVHTYNLRTSDKQLKIPQRILRATSNMASFSLLLSNNGSIY